MRFKFWIIYGLLLLMFSASAIKMATVMVDRDIAVIGNSQGRKTITVASARGTIYDRHLSPLVNADNQRYIAMTPDYENIRSLKPYMSSDSYRALLEKASDGMPLTAQIDSPITPRDGVLLFEGPVRYGKQVLCAHLLGYTDSATGRGAYGLEKVYDDVLSQFSGSIKTTFITNGIGLPVDNQTPTITNTIGNSEGGIVLTIDGEIQEMVDAVAEQYVQKGAVILMDAQNGEIVAMGSYPAFHPEQLQESLHDVNNPFMNRAISLYDCGSVFKIVTSIAALECGIPPERSFSCSGEYEVGDSLFHCHNREGHGFQNMETAFANSCNIYYIKLAQEIGAEAMLKMMQTLKLDESILLAREWETSAALLPNADDLSAEAALANVSFGQGDLMLTPLHATLLAGVIASGGNILSPSVVAGIIDGQGTIIEEAKREGKTVISAGTVRILRSMMRRVVTDGTGVRAQGENVSIAGKTGTAETGQVNSAGYPVVQSWFTGYFPAEQPKYIITVLAEDAQNTGADTLLLACEISNKVYENNRNGD